MSIIINLDLEYPKDKTDLELTYLSNLNNLVNVCRMISDKDLKVNYHKFDDAIINFIENIYITDKYAFSVMKNIKTYIGTKVIITGRLDLEFIVRLLNSMEKVNIKLYKSFGLIIDKLEDINKVSLYRPTDVLILPSLDGSINTIMDVNIFYVNKLVRNGIIDSSFSKIPDTAKYIYSSVFSTLHIADLEDSFNFNIFGIMALASACSIGDCNFKDFDFKNFNDSTIRRSKKLIDENNLEHLFSFDSEIVRKVIDRAKNNPLFSTAFTYNLLEDELIKILVDAKDVKVLSKDDTDILVKSIGNIILSMETDTIKTIYKRLINFSKKNKGFLAVNLLDDEQFKKNKLIKKINLEYKLSE